MAAMDLFWHSILQLSNRAGTNNHLTEKINYESEYFVSNQIFEAVRFPGKCTDFDSGVSEEDGGGQLEVVVGLPQRRRRAVHREAHVGQKPDVFLWGFNCQKICSLDSIRNPVCKLEARWNSKSDWGLAIWRYRNKKYWLGKQNCFCHLGKIPVPSTICFRKMYYGRVAERKPRDQDAAGSKGPLLDVQ